MQAGDLLYVLDPTDAEDDMLDAEVELKDLYEQLSDLQESIAGQTVTAAVSGRVESISVEKGKKVQSGAALVFHTAGCAARAYAPAEGFAPAAQYLLPPDGEPVRMAATAW